jgi:hypothetical protein
MVSNQQNNYFQNQLNRDLQERCKELESIARTIRKEQRLLEEYLGVSLTTEKVYKKKEVKDE